MRFNDDVFSFVRHAPNVADWPTSKERIIAFSYPLKVFFSMVCVTLSKTV